MPQLGPLVLLSLSDGTGLGLKSDWDRCSQLHLRRTCARPNTTRAGRRRVTRDLGEPTILARHARYTRRLDESNRRPKVRAFFSFLLSVSLGRARSSSIYIHVQSCIHICILTVKMIYLSVSPSPPAPSSPSTAFPPRSLTSSPQPHARSVFCADCRRLAVYPLPLSRVCPALLPSLG